MISVMKDPMKSVLYSPTVLYRARQAEIGTASVKSCLLITLFSLIINIYAIKLAVEGLERFISPESESVNVIKILSEG